MKNNTIEICNLVLAEADLMCLVGLHDDENEYYPEAVKVAEYIDNDNPNVDDLSRYIQQVFISYFGECFELDVCKLIADCILKNLECEEE